MLLQNPLKTGYKFQVSGYRVPVGGLQVTSFRFQGRQYVGGDAVCLLKGFATCNLKQAVSLIPLPLR
jgi:hypothetical protein